jgi:hypothetical protein
MKGDFPAVLKSGGYYVIEIYSRKQNRLGGCLGVRSRKYRKRYGINKRRRRKGSVEGGNCVE